MAPQPDPSVSSNGTTKMVINKPIITIIPKNSLLARQALKGLLNTGDIEKSWARKLEAQLSEPIDATPASKPNLKRTQEECNLDQADNDDSWHLPKKPIKPTVRSTSKESLNSTNVFDVLQMDTTNDNEDPRSPQTATRARGNHPTPQQHILNNSKPPTIEIWNAQLRELVQSLEEVLATKPDWFTYTPMGKKPKNIVLKRLSKQFDEESITKYIEKLNIPTIKLIKVSKYYFDNNNKNIYHYLVQLDYSSIAKDLMSQTLFLHQRVTWEWLKKKKVFQCKRCQRVGHASYNCNFAPRCVKCGESHNINECKIPKDANKEALTCVNCKKTGRPASYHGCEYLKYAQQQKNLRKQTQKNTILKKIRTPSRKTIPTLSFAQSLNSNSREEFPPIGRNTKRTAQQYTQKSQLNFPNHNEGPGPEPAGFNEQLQALSNLIKTQFDQLSAQIAINSSRIDYILEHLEYKP